jgi:hypothetical protein
MVSEKQGHEEHEGNEGHEEKKQSTTDRADENGPELITPARKNNQRRHSTEGDGIDRRSERSVLICFIRSIRC